ncbi:hypothetical protein [Sorangium sp. So ce887]|uniref:hypothetical protein n=1 Tax=Sorangium sp. So ce887 TaxID=3133324 RepID=UPI003F613F46
MAIPPAVQLRIPLDGERRHEPAFGDAEQVRAVRNRPLAERLDEPLVATLSPSGDAVWEEAFGDLGYEEAAARRIS